MQKDWKSARVQRQKNNKEKTIENNQRKTMKNSTAKRFWKWEPLLVVYDISTKDKHEIGVTAMYYTHHTHEYRYRYYTV